MFMPQFLVVFLVLPTATAFSQSSCTDSGLASRQSFQLQERASRSSSRPFDEKSKRKCSICPEPEENVDMDRREASFAMLGTLWALSPLPSHAVYGQDAKIELPDIVDSMNKRATQQCLVETLGNRECLVYLDPANKLYQNPEQAVLLERIEKASIALSTIPELVESKCWSKVNGVLTGPLGDLVLTMNQLLKLSENSEQASNLAKKIKMDIIEIGASAERKQSERAVEYHQKATNDLVAFVKTI
jgi:hypothetical protein